MYITVHVHCNILMIGYLLLVLHILPQCQQYLFFYIDDADLDILRGTDGYGGEQSSNWRRFSYRHRAL